MTEEVTMHCGVARHFPTSILVIKCHSPPFVLFQDGGQRKPCDVTQIHFRLKSCAGILAGLFGGNQL